MTNKDTGTGFIIGVFVGVTLGLAIGFIYAPQPGANTRQLIKEKAEEVEEKATGVIDKMRESTAKARYKKRWAKQRGT